MQLLRDILIKNGILMKVIQKKKSVECVFIEIGNKMLFVIILTYFQLIAWVLRRHAAFRMTSWMCSGQGASREILNCI